MDIQTKIVATFIVTLLFSLVFLFSDWLFQLNLTWNIKYFFICGIAIGFYTGYSFDGVEK